MAAARRKPLGICPDCRRPVKALPLSWQEGDILEKIMQEKWLDQIAKELFISRRSVETHLASLYLKTGVSELKGQAKLTGLVKWAIKHQFVDLWDEA